MFLSFNSIFEFVIGKLLLVLIGGACIVFGVVIKVIDLNFKRKGVKVKLKVKDVEKNIDSENGKSEFNNGYKTTFIFDYNGKEMEETLITEKRFKKDSILNGVFLPDGKRNRLSVAGEGFYLAQGGDLFLIIFGILVALIGLYVMFDISVKIVIYTVIIFAVLFFIIIRIIIKSNNNDIMKNQAYKSEVYDETFSVDATLIRYIPKVKRVKTSLPELIILVLITLGAGICFFLIGIKTLYSSISIKLTYPSTNGKISNVYDYITFESGEKIKNKGIVYDFHANGQTYSIDNKLGISLTRYKVGDSVKVYYDDENPENAILNSELYQRGTLVILGIMFIYVGVYIILNYRKKNAIYKKYTELENV